jgi:NhaP-type Na+/H+ or K+/H+ antiporter
LLSVYLRKADKPMPINSYEISLLIAGLAMLLAVWLPQAVAGRQMTLPLIFIAAGMVISTLPLSIEAPLPVEQRFLWEKVSELAVLVSLFAAGLKIDTHFSLRKWSASWRLLLVAMPLTIAATTLLGLGLAGLSIPAALLIGAAMAPTDPVMASDVQVGPPMSGKEDTVRLTLTAEAGLNDGLAFPFVYLAIAAAAAAASPESVALSEFLARWLLIDLLYRCAAGFAIGVLCGWVLGRIIFHYPRNAPLAHEGIGYVALAVVLICRS